MEVLPGGEVWFLSGHDVQVLIPPGEPSGLYVPGGQAVEQKKTWQKGVQDIHLSQHKFSGVLLYIFTVFFSTSHIERHLGQ